MQEEAETDVTLIVRRRTDLQDDKDGYDDDSNDMVKIEAHRVILRAASPYFAAMFAEKRDSTGERKAAWSDANGHEVTIKVADPQSFQFIINFIYGKQKMPATFKSNEELLNLIQTADMLQMDALKDCTIIARRNKEPSDDRDGSADGESRMISVNAYSAALRAASPTLAKKLPISKVSWPDGKRRKVTLRDMDPRSVKHIIQLLHADDKGLEGVDTIEPLISLLETAVELEVSAIRDPAIESLIDLAEASNMCTILDVLQRMDDDNDQATRTRHTILYNEFMRQFTEVASYPDQNALIPYDSIKDLLTPSWKKVLNLDECEVYTRAIDCWMLGKVTKDGQTDPKRLKYISKIYSKIAFDKMDKTFLAEIVAGRDKHLWDKKGVCNELVLEAMRRHLLK